MTSKTTLFGLLLIAATASQAQYPSEAIGKQRAGTSRLAWEVREGLHPNLGTLKSALLKAPIETAAGGSRVYSRVTFACDKAAARLVIVLANSSAADGAAPLRPATEPLLFCNRAEAPGDTKLVREEVLATWETTKGGESVAAGLRPFPLHECASISVVQEVALPAGASQKSARVEFDLFPYSREFDSVFMACGDTSAYGSEPAQVAASTPAPEKTAAPTPAPVVPKPPPAIPKAQPVAPPAAQVIAKAPMTSAPPAAGPAPTKVPATSPPPAPAATAASGDGWLNARVLSTGGKTNLRSGASLTSSVVEQLDPGTVIRVQQANDEWWRVRVSAHGRTLEGFIRQDRIAFR